MILDIDNYIFMQIVGKSEDDLLEHVDAATTEAEEHPEYEAKTCDQEKK